MWGKTERLESAGRISRPIKPTSPTRLIFGLAVLTGLCAACTAEVSEPVAKTTVSYGPGTRFATYERGDDPTPDALIRGVLAVEQDCLVVAGRRGDRSILPLFPVEATSFDERSGILTLDGQTFALGSKVAFGGGDFTPKNQSAKERQAVFDYIGVEFSGCDLEGLNVWLVGGPAEPEVALD